MKALLLLLLLSSPAYADAFPPGVKAQRVFPGEERGPAPRITAADPLGYRPAVFPRIPGGVSSERIFDRPVTGGGRYGVPLWAPGRGSRADWNPPGLDRPPGDNGEPPITPPPRPEPPVPPDVPDVPGPLPVLGLGAAFVYSRKLRNRIKS